MKKVFAVYVTDASFLASVGNDDGNKFFLETTFATQEHAIKYINNKIEKDKNVFRENHYAIIELYTKA